MHSSIGSVGSILGELNFFSTSNSDIEFAVGDGITNKIQSNGNIYYSGFSSNGTIKEKLDYLYCGTNMTRSVCTSYDTYYLTVISNKNDTVVYGETTIIDMI